jgi:predicted RNA-binding Zn ribbon-like protein
MQSVAWRTEEEPELFLALVNSRESYRDVVTDRLAEALTIPDWLHQHGIVTAEESAQLRERFAIRPQEAGRWLSALHRFRTGLRAATQQLIDRGSLEPEQVLQINEILRLSGPPQLTEASPGTYRFVAGPVSLRRVLVSFATSFSGLLVSGRTSRLGECENPVCSFVFFDVSPTGRRRWCSMRTCGNQAKVGRYQARHRSRRTRSP